MSEKPNDVQPGDTLRMLKWKDSDGSVREIVRMCAPDAEGTIKIRNGKGVLLRSFPRRSCVEPELWMQGAEHMATVLSDQVYALTAERDVLRGLLQESYLCLRKHRYYMGEWHLADQLGPRIEAALAETEVPCGK